MALDLPGVARLVADELATVANRRVARELAKCLIPPLACLLDWDYGHPHPEFPEPRYPGFLVAKFPESATGIAYSEYGSGPAQPWVLVLLDRPGYGMDSSWFTTLEGAFRESMAWNEPPPISRGGGQE